MGCITSKHTRFAAYAAAGDVGPEATVTKETPAAKVKEPAAQALTATPGNPANQARPKLDPKDFRFVECKNETKIKRSGTINGQSFIIDNCENCDIYVLDHCSQVTIDDSKGCRIYIGPTDGAVFVRNCTGCTLAVVCRQLRTRDCSDCHIALHCRTKPIVESSSRVNFACLDLTYPGLQEHMRRARLGPFHNFWSDVYDFTPQEQGGSNWHLLPAATRTADLLEPVPAEAAELLTAGESSAAQQPLLKPLGGRQTRPDGHTYLFVAFEASKHEQALQLAAAAADKGWLLRTNEARLNATAAGALATEAGWAKNVPKALAAQQGTAGCVGVELAVPAAEADAWREQVKRLGGHSTDSEAPAKTFRFMGLDG